MTHQLHDVAIVGSALNGLAAANALGGKCLRSPLKVVVADIRDPRDFSSADFDGRASAITATAKNFLQALGAWPSLEGHAQPIVDIIVTDSDKGPADRPVLLEFAAGSQASEPSAYMIENRFLYEALLQAALASPHIEFAVGQPVEDFSFGPGPARLSFPSGAQIGAALVIAADGKRSSVRQSARIPMQGWDYDQTAIVLTVEHDLPHHGRAEEHFNAAGPFAILPLPGNRSSLVWTETHETAKRLLALAPDEFLRELESKFGDHLGQVRVVSRCHGYPLSLYVAESFHAERLALVGDAAHVIHPLAGLGFNLGIRDVAALAECVHDAAGLGMDIGSMQVLESYTMWRRFDTMATAAAVDGLNRLFTSSWPVMKLLRDTGLKMVDRMGSLKAGFMSEAAGQTGHLPKLLKGQKL